MRDLIGYAGSEAGPRYMQVARLGDGTLTKSEVAERLGMTKKAVDGAARHARAQGLNPRFKFPRAHEVRLGDVPLHARVRAVANGKRTIDQVARLCNATREQVRSAARVIKHRHGETVEFHDDGANARLDRSVLQMVDRLQPEVAEWLRNAVPKGSSLPEFIRAIIVDAYHDELDRNGGT